MESLAHQKTWAALCQVVAIVGVPVGGMTEVLSLVEGGRKQGMTAGQGMRGFLATAPRTYSM